MGNDEDAPLSSEELLKRAREGQAADAASRTDMDMPSETVDDAGPVGGIEADQDIPDPGITSRDAGATPSDRRPAAPNPSPPTNSPPRAEPQTEPGEAPTTLWGKAWAWFRGWGRWVVLGFILVNVVVGYLASGSNVADVAVGECFMDPGTEDIGEVEVVDCSEHHDYELVGKVPVTGLGDPYPGFDAIVDWGFERCVAKLVAYVEPDFDESAYWPSGIVPSEDTWDDGDRTILCTVYLGDSAGNVIGSSGSVRKAGIFGDL